MTFSRLTLGEPRLRGRARGGTVEALPCEEPMVYGANILRDPLFSGRTGFDDRGPAGQDFSFGGGTASFSTLTDSHWALSQGGSVVEVDDPDYWKVSGWDTWDDYTAYTAGTSQANHTQIVSTANPHAGTHHYRGTWSPVSGDTGSLPDTFGLQVIGVYVCADTSTAPMVAACRVEPGDFVGFSIWWDINQAAVFAADVVLRFADSDGNHFGSGVTSSYARSGTGYTEMTVDGIAPAGAYFATVAMGAYPDDFSQAQYVGIAVDFSDATLEVQP